MDRSANPRPNPGRVKSLIGAPAGDAPPSGLGGGGVAGAGAGAKRARAKPILHSPSPLSPRNFFFFFLRFVGNFLREVLIVPGLVSVILGKCSETGVMDG